MASGATTSGASITGVDSVGDSASARAAESGTSGSTEVSLGVTGSTRAAESATGSAMGLGDDAGSAIALTLSGTESGNLGCWAVSRATGRSGSACDGAGSTDADGRLGGACWYWCGCRYCCW
jgi:hypothetical protein